MREILFFFDIVCPYAYTASTLISELSLRLNARFIWTPVLLGGLYRHSKAPQGANGSAMDVMPMPKFKYSQQDLIRAFQRYNVPNNIGNVLNNQKTINAMRLIAASPDANIMLPLAQRLFRMYWIECRDVTDILNLQEAIDDVKWDATAEILLSEPAKLKLISNTNLAFSKGAFGVPSFWANEKLFFGIDRVPLIAKHLGIEDYKPLRLYPNPTTPRKANLTFYYDYSSPWTFLAYMQLDRLLRNVAPVEVSIEFVPVLVGALFKEIGQAVVPATIMPEAKVFYYSNELQLFAEYHDIFIKYSSHFPLRTVLALRADIASGHDRRLMSALFKSAWQNDMDISDKDVVKKLVYESGLDGASIIDQSETDAIKSKLRENTDLAVKAGVFGVPSFKVNGGLVIWGQDRMNVVEDLLCGWEDIKMEDYTAPVSSKL